MEPAVRNMLLDLHLNSLAFLISRMLGYRWCCFSAGPWLSESIWLCSSVVGMAFMGGESWVLEATSVKTKVHSMQILWVVSDALVLGGIVARNASRCQIST